MVNNTDIESDLIKSLFYYDKSFLSIYRNITAMKLVLTTKSSSSSSKLEYIPSFRLSGINPQAIFAKYQASGYSDLKLPTTRIKFGNNLPIMAPIYGTSGVDPVYTFQDRNNTTMTMATGDHKNYEFFNKNGGKLPEGGTCQHCHRKFTHKIMQCPIDMERIEICTPVTHGSTNHVKYAIHGISTLCGFRCTLSYIKLHYATNTKLVNSEYYLNFMFTIMYPGKELKPAPDPELLISNGGSLSDEEYDSSKYYYYQSVNILLSPVKTEYFRVTL